MFNIRKAAHGFLYPVFIEERTEILAVSLVYGCRNIAGVGPYERCKGLDAELTVAIFLCIAHHPFYLLQQGDAMVGGEQMCHFLFCVVRRAVTIWLCSTDGRFSRLGIEILLTAVIELKIGSAQERLLPVKNHH